MADVYLTPEQIGLLQSYGEGLLKEELPRPTRDREIFGPLNAIAHAAKSFSGRQHLNLAEQHRARQRSALGGEATPEGITHALGSPSPSANNSGGSGGFVDRLIHLESGGRTDALNPAGTRRGLGQFSRELEQRYGITDWQNPDQQRSAIQRHAEDNARVFQQRFGRAPSQGELYLMHQQGVAGGPALLDPANASRTAYEVLLPLYNNNARTAQSAIQGNLPGHLKNQWRNITAADFARQWTSRFGDSGGATTATAAAPSREQIMSAVAGGPVQETNLPPVNPLQRFSPQANRTTIPAGALEGRLPAVQAAPQRVAQVGEIPPAAPQGAGNAPPQNTGATNERPQGVPDRVDVDPNTRNEIRRHQLALSRSLIGTLTPEERQRYEQRYQELIKPIQREFPGGTAEYSPQTGQFLRFNAKLITSPIHVGDTQVNRYYEMDPVTRQFRPITISPSGQVTPVQPGTQQPGTSTADTAGATDLTPIPPLQIPPIPDSSDPAALAQWNMQRKNIEEMNKGRTSIVQDAINTGNSAREMDRALRTLAAAEGNNVIGGPLSQWTLPIRQAFTQITGLDFSTTAPAEAIQKLATGLAASASRVEFGNRITQSEFQRYLDSAVPSLSTSPSGRRMLIDLLMQNAQRQVDLRNIALRAKSNEDYLNREERYNRDNPIILRLGEREINTSTARPGELARFFQQAGSANPPGQRRPQRQPSQSGLPPSQGEFPSELNWNSNSGRVE